MAAPRGARGASTSRNPPHGKHGKRHDPSAATPSTSSFRDLREACAYHQGQVQLLTEQLRATPSAEQAAELEARAGAAEARVHGLELKLEDAAGREHRATLAIAALEQQVASLRDEMRRSVEREDSMREQLRESAATQCEQLLQLVVVRSELAAAESEAAEARSDLGVERDARAHSAARLRDANAAHLAEADECERLRAEMRRLQAELDGTAAALQHARSFARRATASTARLASGEASSASATTSACTAAADTTPWRQLTSQHARVGVGAGAASASAVAASVERRPPMRPPRLTDQPTAAEVKWAATLGLTPAAAELGGGGNAGRGDCDATMPKRRLHFSSKRPSGAQPLGGSPPVRPASRLAAPSHLPPTRLAWAWVNGTDLVGAPLAALDREGGRRLHPPAR